MIGHLLIVLSAREGDHERTRDAFVVCPGRVDGLGCLLEAFDRPRCAVDCGEPDVVETYARVGVAPRRLPALATVLLAGAAGLLGGFVWTPLGVAAAVALALYFVLALIAHATHHDLAHAATPTFILILAIAATVLFALEL